MKILLVEDEAPKREHITQLLKAKVSRGIVRHAMSVSSALDMIEDELPDILLLDMSLPTYDIVERESGGRPQGFGGIEVLRHMKMSGNVCPTVIITGYEAFQSEDGPMDLACLSDKLSEEFPEILKAVLSYDSTYPEWKTELNKLLNGDLE
jgi:CheY-like chemotaxis protein